MVYAIYNGFCCYLLLVSLQNGSVIGSLEAKLSLGGIKMCEVPATLYSSFYDLQNASCSEHRLIKDQL